MLALKRLLGLSPQFTAAQMTDAKQLVHDTVAAHKVAVFSKSFCPYCVKAKKALGSLLKPEDIFVMELDQRRDGPALQTALKEITGGTSVPRVFIGGQFIGGGDDTAAKAASGELAKLLQAQGLGLVNA